MTGPTNGPITGSYSLTRKLAILTAALFLLSLLVGPSGIGLPDGTARWPVLVEIRLPRALLAVLIGGALGLAGAALQGYLRNALAEPGLIGASSGAGLGAVLAIHSGASAAFSLALPLGGLAGAALATLAVLALAGTIGRDATSGGGPLPLILAGVAVSSLATALIALALNLSANPFAAVEIVYWLMGSLADRSMNHVLLAAPPIALGIMLLLRLAPALDALSLGEDAAANLGVDLTSLQRTVIAGTALVVGAATAVAGTIGFVGLMVPHVLRPHVGHAPGRLLPASLAGGAALVLAADILLRLLAPSGELRLGVLTALIGAPFFLWLVARMRHELEP